MTGRIAALALFLSACGAPELEPLGYAPRQIDQARISADGSVVGYTTKAEGNRAGMCWQGDPETLLGSGGRLPGKRDPHLAGVGDLELEQGPFPFVLCYGDEHISASTERPQSYYGFEREVEADIADLRIWSGQGMVALTSRGMVAWHRAGALDLHRSEPEVEHPFGCPALDRPFEVADFQVIDEDGTIAAVGPDGLVLASPDGKLSCDPTLGGERVEADGDTVWVVDGDTIHAVDPWGERRFTETIAGVLDVAADDGLVITKAAADGDVYMGTLHEDGEFTTDLDLDDGIRGVARRGDLLLTWDDATLRTWRIKR